MTRSIALILLFWMFAALLVVAVAQELTFASPITAAGVKLGVIIVVAYLFARARRHPASLDQALIVGALWLLLDIIAELAVTTHTGRAWFALIGSPAAPVLRYGLLLGWISAPALFARRSDTSNQ